MIVLARTISLEIFGVLAAYLNVLGIVLLLTNFGFSEYLLVNSETNRKLTFNKFYFLNSSLLLAFILLLIVLIIPISFKLIFLGLIIKLYFENVLITILLAYHQVKDKVNTIAYLNITNSILTTIICLWFYFLKLDVYAYLLAFAIIYALSFGYLLKTQTRLKLISPIRTIRFLRRELKSIRFYGFSMVTIPIYMMSPNVIGAILCSPEDFAVYQVAFSITSIILLVSNSWLQSDYPGFLRTNSKKGLRKLLSKSAIKILGLNVLIIILFVIAGKDILLMLYQKEIFLNAYKPLIYLLISNTLLMFASILAVVMVINKEQRLKTRYHLEFILISVVLSTVLVTLNDIYGIVYTYLIMYMYVLARYFRKYLLIKLAHND